MKVSAIISTYNAANLIRGCLEDLLNQTLYQKGELEIVVIDSGSLENEGQIVLELQKEKTRIEYLRTEERESIYQAWNRGIQMATGKYITNANTDDRHDVHCLEKLVDHLEENPDDDIAYGNLFKSVIPNETFEQNDRSRPCLAQTFFPSSLLMHNYIGAQPMWRKSLHDKIGLFDEEYEIVGDYEFVLRAISQGATLSFVPEAKGLMLWHEKALSTRDQRGIFEIKALHSKYRQTEKIHSTYRDFLDCADEDLPIETHLDLGIRALCYFPQFSSGTPRFDFEFAYQNFNHSVQHSAFEHNLRSLQSIICGNYSSDRKTTEPNSLTFYGCSQNLPTEYELKGVKPAYLSRSGEENIGGQLRQRYSFDLGKFREILLGHLPVDHFLSSDEIFIWGLNERGKLLGNYLKSMGQKKIRFIESSKSEYVFHRNFQDFEIISFDDLDNLRNAVFVLAMSAHHWKNVMQQINRKIAQPSIYKLDRE